MNTFLKEALNNYEIQHPQIEFLRHNENETYNIRFTTHYQIISMLFEYINRVPIFLLIFSGIKSILLIY